MTQHYSAHAPWGDTLASEYAENVTTYTLFSLFSRPVSNTVPLCATDLLTTWRYITGPSAKPQTDTLRTLCGPAARAYKAVSFDFVTFSGLFRRRSAAGLVTPSHLLCIDFDHIRDPPELKRQLLRHPYLGESTELMFTSPSGDGVKWVVAVEPRAFSHRDFFRTVTNCLADTGYPEPDMSGSDIARACFLPHDPEAYINPLRKIILANH